MLDASLGALERRLGEAAQTRTGTPLPLSSSVRYGLVDGVGMRKALVPSESRKKDVIPEESILDELSRILESPMFVQSERLGRFLRFTVEKTLAGEAETLKEYLIGTQVYERKPSYHPGDDSIVRSEARRLRSKLKEYYESVGNDDPVLISYRPGSYVPVFQLRQSEARAATRDDAPGERFADGRGIRVAVLPFVDASRARSSGACAQIITDELIHELVRTEGLRVTAASSVAPLAAQALDVPSLARQLDVQVVFEGTVREENNRLRITSRVINADGFQIWSERFETKTDTQSLFKLSEKIASSLISRVRPEQALIHKQKSSEPSELGPLGPNSNGKTSGTYLGSNWEVRPRDKAQL